MHGPQLSKSNSFVGINRPEQANANQSAGFSLGCPVLAGIPPSALTSCAEECHYPPRKIATSDISADVTCHKKATAKKDKYLQQNPHLGRGNPHLGLAVGPWLGQRQVSRGHALHMAAVDQGDEAWVKLPLDLPLRVPQARRHCRHYLAQPQPSVCQQHLHADDGTCHQALTTTSSFNDDSLAFTAWAHFTLGEHTSLSLLGANLS